MFPCFRENPDGIPGPEMLSSGSRDYRGVCHNFLPFSKEHRDFFVCCFVFLIHVSPLENHSRDDQVSCPLILPQTG